MDGQLRRSAKSQILSVAWQRNVQNMLFLDNVFLQHRNYSCVAVAETS